MAIRIQLAHLFLLGIFLAAGFSSSLSFAATVEEVALMKSPNREKILLEGAKKEGKVSFYTGLIVDQVVRPVKDALDRKSTRLNSSHIQKSRMPSSA